MSIEALLQDTPESIKIGEKEYLLNRFKVMHYAELHSVVSVIARVMSEDADPQVRVLNLLTQAAQEACILIACGSNIEPAEIVNLNPDQFMVALSKVIEQNIDFFLAAARKNTATAKKQPTTTH